MYRPGLPAVERVMITTMAACDLTHKEAYKHLFMITVVLAFVNLCLCVGLGLCYINHKNTF